MLKLELSALLALGFAGAAFAQAPTDHVKLDVTRAQLQAIGQGVMKLPYEAAAPLLIELQRQLEAQSPKAEPSGGTATGAFTPVTKPEDKPAKK